MMQKSKFNVLIGALLALGTVGLALPSLSLSSLTSSAGLSQKGKGGGGGGGQRGGGGGGQRGGGGGAQQRQERTPQAPPQEHARRDAVRTNNYVPKPGGNPVPPVRDANNNAPRRTENVNGSPKLLKDRAFTKTAVGRRYDNGLVLRKGIKVTAPWEKRYFPHGYAHFPFYVERYNSGSCFYSPFGFYFGVCLPFISISVGNVYPPSVVFIDPVVYHGNNWYGWGNVSDQNLLNDPNLDQEEPGLNNALDEINEAYQSGNIDGIVTLTEPSVSVAIFRKGIYQYTLAANDFLDLTRDALHSTTTVGFQFTYLHQRAPGVFSVGAQHSYKGFNGATRSVYVNYVLQDFSGQWTITQVGTSPDIWQN